MSINEHPDLLYNANVLKHALCIKLQHGTLVAPFNAKLNTALSIGRRLTFTHKSGLTLQIVLPLGLAASNGKGIRFQHHSEQTVQAGQEILQVDMQYFQQQQPIYAAVILMVLPTVQTVFSAMKHVEAGLDPIFVIQLTKK